MAVMGRRQLINSSAQLTRIGPSEALWILEYILLGYMTALNWPGNDEVKKFSNTVGSLVLDFVMVRVAFDL